MNPPNKKIISSPADPNVLAIIISREMEAMARKRPSAIWCTVKSKSMKRKNLKNIYREWMSMAKTYIRI